MGGQNIDPRRLGQEGSIQRLQVPPVHAPGGGAGHDHGHGTRRLLHCLRVG